MTRYPHIADKVLEQLDNKSLVNYREVAVSWQRYVDDKDLTWLRIVKIPTIFRCEDTTYLHLAAKLGQMKMFELIFESEEVKNPRNIRDLTPFHIACLCGHLKIAEFIIHKSKIFNIDLNTKCGANSWFGYTASPYKFLDRDASTALHLASPCFESNNKG